MKIGTGYSSEMNANRIAWLASVVVFSFFMTGCVSPNYYSQYYHDNLPSAGTNVSVLLPYSGQTRIVTTTNPTNDINTLARAGYAILGESVFQVSGSIDSGSLMSQAKKVGADVVLCESAYLGSYQGAMPLLQYNPGTTSTTYSSGTMTANAYGNGGYAYGTGNYYGNSTTTTPGTFSTQMIPVTMARYSYDAVFWRKRKPPVFGVIPIPISDELKGKLQRNTGVLIAIIYDDSPAFRANLLEGDVILSMAGEDVLSPSDLSNKLFLHKGQKVDVGIWRNGELKTISVQLDSP
jgi:hypothetical protein